MDEVLEDVEEEQDAPARKRKAAVFDSDEEEDAAPVDEEEDAAPLDKEEDAAPPQPAQAGSAAVDNDMADIFGSDDDD